jgi:hypothetical protein
VARGQDALNATRTHPLRPSDAAGLGAPIPGEVKGSGLLARVVGVDPDSGRPMTEDERAQLGDPFFALVLGRDRFPATAAETLAALDAANAAPDGLPEQMVFVVSEAGQIAFDAASAALPRKVRYVVTRARPPAGPTVLVSTRPASDDPSAFLQVAAWDERNKVYHFYERVGPAWFWEGSSAHAFGAGSRGRDRSTATSTVRW